MHIRHCGGYSEEATSLEVSGTEGSVRGDVYTNKRTLETIVIRKITKSACFHRPDTIVVMRGARQTVPAQMIDGDSLAFVERGNREDMEGDMDEMKETVIETSEKAYIVRYGVAVVLLVLVLGAWMLDMWHGKHDAAIATPEKTNAQMTVSEKSVILSGVEYIVVQASDGRLVLISVEPERFREFATATHAQIVKGNINIVW